MQLFYELTPADLSAAQRLFYLRRRAATFWMITLYGGVAMLFGVWEFSRHRPTFFIPLLLGLYLVLYLPVLTPRGAQKNWPKTRALHGPTMLSTSNEGLALENPNIRFFYRWETLLTFDEGAPVWLIRVSPSSFIVISMRAFASPNDQTRFRAELSRIGVGAAIGSPAAPPLAAP